MCFINTFPSRNENITGSLRTNSSLPRLTGDLNSFLELDERYVKVIKLSYTLILSSLDIEVRV